MLPERFIVFVCTYIFAKSDLCGLANGLCIRILRSCYDMGSVFGGKNFDLFILFSLSLFIAKIFFSVCFYDSKKMRTQC